MPVANLRAAVGINCVFDGAFVVINEQARRRENSARVFASSVKLNGSGDGVRGATAQFQLVIKPAGIAGEGQLLAGNAPGQFHRCGVKMVAFIRQIGQPAVTSIL